MEFTLTTWTGICLVVLTLVSALKAGWPGWAAGKEQRLALVLGLLLTIVAKLTHAMSFGPGVEGWLNVLVGGLLAGAAAQLAHDKVVNALNGKGTDTVGAPKAPPPKA